MQALAIILLLAIPLLICVGVWFLTGSVAWVLITLGGLLFLLFLLAFVFYMKVFRAAADMTTEMLSNIDEV